MTIDQIIMTLLGVVCAGLGWFANVLYGAVTSLRTDLSKLEVQINRDYVRHDRFREVMQDAIKPVMDSLHEIKQTLSGKADK